MHLQNTLAKKKKKKMEIKIKRRADESNKVSKIMWYRLFIWDILYWYIFIRI